MDNRVKLTKSLRNNFCHEWLSARTHVVDKCLRFDVGGVVETSPKELNSSRPENVESRHQLQTSKEITYASVKERKWPWMTYLNRQRRNEFINLASQIEYDGKILPSCSTKIRYIGL